MKKTNSLILTLIMALSLCSPALATETTADRSTASAAVTVHNGGELGKNNLSGGECVSDIAEDDGFLYFLVMDSNTGYQTKIICSPMDGDGPVEVCLPEIDGAAGLHFINMEPGASAGTLWAVLEDDAQQARYAALFRSGRLSAFQACEGRAVLGAEGAIWKNDTEFVYWDGTQTAACPIPVPPENAAAFVLWNGSPCFFDSGSHSVLAFRNGEWITLFTAPDDSQAELTVCGGTAYLSYRSDDGTAAGSLIRLSDGERLGGGAFNIQRMRMQSDGSVQIINADSLTNMIKYSQITLFEDALTERIVGEYFTKADAKLPETGPDGLPAGWRFTDSRGNLWIYPETVDTAAAVTKVTKDGTTVRYTAEPASEFGLWYQGTGVSFDTVPYITDTGYTMVPVRGTAYLLGADVVWDGDTHTVTLRRGERTVSLTIGSAAASVDGVETTLDAPAVIDGGRTMLPLRFLAETFGFSVRWENDAVYID